MQAKGVSSDHGDALPAVLREFKQHLFIIIRCINANSFLASDVGKTDEQRIQELKALGVRRHDNASDGNTCLTGQLDDSPPPSQVYGRAGRPQEGAR